MATQRSAERATPSTAWCYAVTREVHDGEPAYEIREVYFSGGDPYASAETLSWTGLSAAPGGASWQECGNDLTTKTKTPTWLRERDRLGGTATP